MIPVVTTEQMRLIDDQSIGGDRATGYSYMVKAGMGLFDAVVEMNLNRDKDEIAIVCGKGNNGGDGYVVGRMLIDKGYNIMCYGLSDGESLSGEARVAYDDYIAAEGNYFHIDDIADLEGFGRFTLIIDALLGTGVKGAPRGLYAELIKLIRTSAKPVISVDTPSGLNNNTGQPSKPAVKADCTVTMGFPKIGQLFYPGRSFIGKLIIKDLGYPFEVVEKNGSSTFLPTLDDLKSLLPPRKPAGSKFDHGLALLLCGSKGMTGSAELASQAALRSGCGMVHLAIPESIVSILSTKLTEPVLHPIAETPKGTPAYKNAGPIIEKSASMQAALIGPGISFNFSTCRLVRDLAAKLLIPVVLDADGINAFKGHTKELKKHSHELVITPHIKEYERIFSTLPSEPNLLIEQLVKNAKALSMTIVLKGNPTVVADKGGKTYILPVGNSGMATAGSGDVLSGIITSLIAQGCKPVDAAVLGAAVHGLAGEKASEKYGEYSVVAGDLVEYIPVVLKNLSPIVTYGMI
jgi:NAD(P)H-hydrate epimerase